MLPCVLSLILFIVAVANSAKDPPTFNGSYTAQAEIVEVMASYGNRIMQIFFEENYDQKGNRSSFFVWEDNQNVTLIEDYKNNQIFQYYRNECSMYTYKDWVASTVLDIKPYETNTTVVFPLKQLLKLNSSTLREKEETKTVYRGISAILWKHRVNYEIQDADVILDVDAYWANNWTVSSGNSIVPLGFILNRKETNKVSKATETFVQTVNVFYFATNVVDQKAFKIPEGMACIGLKNTLPFPKELENIAVFAFNAEFILDGYQEFSTVDVWLDIKNRMLRIDLDLMNTIRDNGDSPAVSRIISYKQGTVYTISKTTQACQLMQLEKYPFEPQIFIEPSDYTTWNTRNFFGLDGTSFIYIGDTEKRGIPCSIWQGERIDWPSYARPTTTLWEWCIANTKSKNFNLDKSNIPVVNLEITIKEVQENKTDMLKKGMKFVYHFYNMKQYTPAYMDTLAFDISPCFLGNNLKLQFFVDLNQSTKDALKNTTNNVNFFSLWKSTINHKIGLNFTSLRIAKLRTSIEANKLFVMFTLLGVHPDLKKDVTSTELSLGAAKMSLESVINSGNLSIDWFPNNKQKLTLKAAPKSLTEQGVSPIVISSTTSSEDKVTKVTSQITKTTDNSISSTNSQKFTKTTHGPIDESSTSSSPTKESIVTRPETTAKPTKNPSSLTQDTQIRHSPGIMALVSILMLFTGSGIGAAGTYYKFKGIPCKK